MQYLVVDSILGTLYSGEDRKEAMSTYRARIEVLGAIRHLRSGSIIFMRDSNLKQEYWYRPGHEPIESIYEREE